ncbi:ABC transporter permease [Corynebacterium bovis]|nr:ABC transporter permease [Corynebacterium bovis]MBB3116785.1 osmoprotectant transport system permease protein [Corynebacterium bovis DSM 20582 = CIP 54.80]MDK8511214.1 ABC transporter permease [Corynebacterium bovis]WJY78395.1 Glycine betaine/carnitine/choline transport system permease protein OpuCB [Corynebacterium bovis DSM 20582 = CIP 54.80]
MLTETFHLLTRPETWSGAAGLWTRVGQHLWYSLLAMAVTVVLAVPAGLAVGHTGRFRGLVIGLGGALRALPSLGLLTFLALAVPGATGHAVVPAVAVLVLLAVPPVLAGTAAGVESVDRDTVVAARAVGLSERQILLRVELPLAAPMIVDGIRSAVLQVLATATVCAYIGLGGLGRYVLDGLATRDYPTVLVGAGSVIVVALVAEGVLALVQRWSRPRMSTGGRG